MDERYGATAGYSRDRNRTVQRNKVFLLTQEVLPVRPGVDVGDGPKSHSESKHPRYYTDLDTSHWEYKW